MPDPKPVPRVRAPRKPLRAHRKPAAGKDERAARLRFKTAVLAVDRGCVVHDDPHDCEDPNHLAAHHVISRQALRKAGLDEFAWSPQNGTAVCVKAHRQHHSRLRPIRMDELPLRCIRFARDHGLERLLERYYTPAG